MLLFADGLLNHGYQVDLLVAQVEGPLRSSLPPQVRLIDLAARKVSTAIPRLVRYLRRERPAALYSTIINANLAAIVAHRFSRVRCPIVIRESNVLDPKSSIRLARKISGVIAPNAYRFADSIIAVSEDVAAELSRRSPALHEKILVLPNPVISKTMLELGEAPIDHPWMQHSSPNGHHGSRCTAKPVVLGAGRLHPQKDFGTLIAAFAEVRATREAKLVILGEGAERQSLEAQIERLGLRDDVSLPGHIENPFPYFSRADLFVLSSRYEGMPNVLLQAMAFGTPVIATDGPSGAGEVLRCSGSGRLVPVGDTKAMAAAICESLDAPKDPAAAQFVAQHYSVEQATRAYLSAAGLS